MWTSPSTNRRISFPCERPKCKSLYASTHWNRLGLYWPFWDSAETGSVELHYGIVLRDELWPSFPRRYVTCTYPIMHLICPLPSLPPPPPPPAKFCISIVFNSSWDGCNTQEKWKTKVMPLFGGRGWGATKVHYRVCMRRWRIYTDCLATDPACDQVNLLCDLNCTAVRTKLLEKDLSLK